MITRSFFLFLVLALSSLPWQSGHAQTRPLVVTTVPAVTALVREVAQNHFTVRGLVSNQQSAHHRALRPSEALSLAQAELVFAASSDLDGFIEKAKPQKILYMDQTREVIRYELASAHRDAHDNDHGDDDHYERDDHCDDYDDDDYRGDDDHDDDYYERDDHDDDDYRGDDDHDNDYYERDDHDGDDHDDDDHGDDHHEGADHDDDHHDDAHDTKSSKDRKTSKATSGTPYAKCRTKKSGMRHRDSTKSQSPQRDGDAVAPMVQAASLDSADHRLSTSASFDPHLWLEPDNAIRFLDVITQALSTLRPDLAAVLEANRDAERQRIQQTVAAITRQLQAHPSRRPYIVYHSAYQYFERHFDLQKPLAVQDRQFQGVRGRQALQRQVEALRSEALGSATLGSATVCLFAEPQTPQNRLDAVSRLLRPDYTGVLDPLGDPERSYSEHLTALADAIVSCYVA